MKELTLLQIENGKNNLIKLNNDLIERFKKNNRRKKADRDYYEYEENKFYVKIKLIKIIMMMMMMMMMMMIMMIMMMIIMKELTICLRNQ